MQTQKRQDFIDLQAQQAFLPALMGRIEASLSHGQYILGSEVAKLEDKLAAYVRIKHAISCSPSTDAPLMPLMAYGVAPGTPSL
jgi:UDP-2-acetamido-2-deoxy-ribo-hexuluronate aminotransferase